MRRLSLLCLPLIAAACSQPAALQRSYNVYFLQDSAVLDPAATQVVSYAAELAKQYPGLKVTVSGYGGKSSEQASTVTETPLAKLRANAVRDQLVSDGIAKSRIERSVHTVDASNLAVAERRVDIDIGDVDSK
ncbi:Hypothetical protein GbCGDNIH6_0878 [Granulibacter bethesdensis]|uniref:OmpA family protein n=1 Tax=Granulibacter bethesdensis TaxID=364410 RepID=UPI00090CD23C|nr:OmpA family protein [Granulibacter bethesdensis]APH56693.1 Hypothetical protein GbCGDNIH6_0878 [Granulibacter bethesdensis]